MPLEDITKKPPHRTVDSLVDDITNKAKSLGESLMAKLDGGPLGSKAPHRMVDSVLDGATKGLQSVGEGVAEAMDKPAEAIGSPPKL